MKVKESVEQLNSLITHFNNGGLDFNATDIEAIKCLLNKRQKLISYLKEQINQCPLIGNNENDMFYIGKMRAYQKILSKIEKE